MWLGKGRRTGKYSFNCGGGIDGYPLGHVHKKSYGEGETGKVGCAHARMMLCNKKDLLNAIRKEAN